MKCLKERIFGTVCRVCVQITGLHKMYGKKGSELVKEVADGEPGQLAAYNVSAVLLMPLYGAVYLGCFIMSLICFGAKRETRVCALGKSRLANGQFSLGIELVTLCLTGKQTDQLGWVSP